MSRGPAARRGAALLSAGLAFALLPAGGSHAAPGATPAKAAGAAHTVTLVTGDKVTVTEVGGGKKAVTVDRAKGATGAVRTQVSGGDVTVVPDEARSYIAAGVLDQRLFNVSELIRQGLADGKADATPLIVTYAGRSARAAAAVPKGAERTRTLPSIGGAAVDADKGRAFWKDLTAPSGTELGAGVGKVWLDGRVTADMADSNAQIGTAQAWEAGLTGKGVKVAVLDTGYDPSHPDLAARVSESKSFIEGEEVADANGHGTHVTSTVGGSGAASDGKEKGVAPDVTLAVGKVLGNGGSGSESQIIAGMEWAAKDIKAKIVSMSIGSDGASDGTDPMAAAVNSLSAETGALFVIAAGNYGAPGTIGSPGAADDALTVGAVDSADEAAYFTSQGPRVGDNALKPDLSAPGVDILAARSSLVEGSGSYETMSGTSMATPHVAGVAALLAQKHPDWTGARLKDALMSSSKQLDASVYALGSGRVSVPDAIGADITATGSADLGYYKWPYDSNQPVTKTVTYSNSSDSAVELSLAVQDAPDGVATLADSTLTVPAHGTASTTVTGDGAKAAVGNTSGQIVASAGGRAVAHTAVGLVKEEERYTLTVHVKDRDGAPAEAFLAVQQLVAHTDPQSAVTGDDGTVELRLAPGTYYVDSFLDVRGSHGKDSLGLGYLANPEIKLDRDRDITLDGRELREVAADVGRTAETRQIVMEADRQANGAELMNAVQVPIKYDSLFAAPTRKVTEGGYEYRTVWRLGKPVLQVDGVRDAVVQSGGTLTEGRRTLSVVDAGAGTAADYAGRNVRGKAVLVRAGDTTTPAEVAQAAQDAGAEALFVTDDAAGRLNTYFGTDDYTDRPLQIATVDAQGAAVLAAAAKKGREIGMTGTRYTPWVYDLSEGHQGSVPDGSLVYRPAAGELAVRDVKFHAVKPQDGGEFRYSLTDTFAVGLGFLERVAFPAERTDYVSTGAGQKWHESVQAGPALSWEQRSGLISYRGGTRKELDWFKPVWHPWLGTGLTWGQERAGNNISLNTPGWGDSGPDHTGFGDAYSSDSGMTQETAVYADGVEVDRRTSSGAYVWDAAPAERTYKVTTDTGLDAGLWGLATKGHAEWTFKSAATPADRSTPLTLINLGFDLDTGLTGAVRGGKRLPVGIFAEYTAGATATGKLGGGRLEVSYDDGATWKSVSLKGEGASWSGELNVPRDAKYVSLRASARDDKGAAVSQEVVRAVPVQ
ncbi:S8 family serine peptidase [Streptomyces sp. SID8379]|uniref:S8 family serine peptidase n=1 Tax=unclassified Streptomyces TaxID=2593676 RepID=UPI0003A864F5|nr:MULTISPECIES: S8 family serine peptidase [unclassified Streptomyces]MYW65514.1 S8 family serine peptidase [Streptomyces sp. SID8379]